MAGTPARRFGGALAVVLAICAALATVAWGPLIVAAGENLRPNQLDQNNNLSDAELGAILKPSFYQLCIDVLASFAVIALLTALAIFLGRRAFRASAGGRVFLHARTWALLCLPGGLVLGVAFGVLIATAFYSYPLSVALNPISVSLPMAGAVGSVIASSIALFRPLERGQSQGWRWGLGAYLGLALLGVLAGVSIIVFWAWWDMSFYFPFAF